MVSPLTLQDLGLELPPHNYCSMRSYFSFANTSPFKVKKKLLLIGCRFKAKTEFGRSKNVLAML